MSIESYQTIANKLPIGERGQELIAVGFYITMYFENGHLPERRNAAYKLFHEYWGWCGSKLHWTTNPRTNDWEPVTPDYLPERWLRRQPSEAWVWDITYHSGSTFDSTSVFRIDAAGNPEPNRYLSYLNVTLPVTWFAEHTGEEAPALVRRWCNILTPLHGSAGLAILTPLARGAQSEAAAAAMAMARRFPGLEIDYPLSHSLYLQKGIKSVNWLNFLDGRFLTQLGGTAALRDRLDPGSTLYDYAGGAILQAGPYPQAGDANQRIDIVPYRKLASILRPVQATYPSSFLGFDRDSTQEWLHRFE